MAAAIRLRGAVSLLGRFPALAGLDLDVERGEVVHVAGPNGAGKTTLLRALAGLVAVTAGEATVLGHDLRRDRRSVRRQVGYLAHRPFLYDDLTVAENLRFALRAARLATTAAMPALERLGLERLAPVAAGQLSYGQRRRVGLAMLAARQPELLLLDEPHAGLDHDARAVVDGIIVEAGQAGKTVVLASHDHDRTAALGRTVTMVSGGLGPTMSTREESVDVP